MTITLQETNRTRVNHEIRMLGQRLTTVESDAVQFYRSTRDGLQIYRLNAAVTGVDGTSAQSVFGVGCTLTASTVYDFMIVFTLQKTAGVNSHTIAFGFGGTATATNILYESIHTATPATAASAAANIRVTVSNAATVTTTALATAALNANFLIRGTVSINAGGTFIPQYTLSAAPGGAYDTRAGSYMTIVPIGAAGAAVNVGTWA